MNNKYSNAPTNRAHTSGTTVAVAIASNVGAGPDYPCVKALIQARFGNTGIIKVAMNATASATLGIQVPTAATANNGSNLMELEIDNLNKLTFYGGTNGDDIDIIALR